MGTEGEQQLHIETGNSDEEQPNRKFRRGRTTTHDNWKYRGIEPTDEKY